jgi:fatty-acyl-CoA synthase
MGGLHPSHHARSDPDKPAMILADSGEVLTYRQLDLGSNRVAQLFRAMGLRPGDRIAAMMRNSVEFAQLYWGGQRSGLFITLLSTHLKPDEAAYIVNDSASQALVVSASLGETPRALVSKRAELIPAVRRVFSVEHLDGAELFADALAAMPCEPATDEISGFHMIYSSGTTGRPKGVAMPFVAGPIDQPHQSEGSTRLYEAFQPLISFNAGPTYHGAPLNCMLLTQRLGGTFVTLRKFDAEAVLRAIATYRVNHAQFVPTMFVRLLALPDAVRAAHDLSSLRFVLHAAAPCPVEIKRRMIDWLGPIVAEYYASTEGVGSTYITSEEWLRKPGSVGKSALGPIHICDEAGVELPRGEAGVIWFEAPAGRWIEYLNDPEKTRKATHPDHANWYTVGDIGRLDQDGYLFLTDRKDFMIISGGVNIYPQAIEDCLIVHPRVADAAVIGVANIEFGEEVKAIVEPKNWAEAGDALAGELDAWCRGRISAVTCPKSYEFVRELPRIPSGKLAKHELRKLYGNPVSMV